MSDSIEEKNQRLLRRHYGVGQDSRSLLFLSGDLEFSLMKRRPGLNINVYL